MIYIDTHVVIWLYEKKISNFSKKALKDLEKNDIFISPIVELEIIFLKEIGKINNNQDDIVETLTHEIFLQICDSPFSSIIKIARGESWTRDPFDRIITAHAKFNNAPLITKDKMIRKEYSKAFW